MMELIGDKGHVEPCFSLFGDGVQDRCTVCTKRTTMVVQGDEAQVEARFGPFGDSANLDTR
jgi:hypothetical protein